MMPANATIGEGVSAILRGKSVEELRADGNARREASNADNGVAKRRLTETSLDVDAVGTMIGRIHRGEEPR